MEIAFATRSSFLSEFEAAINDQRVRLKGGESIEIRLASGGYPGTVIASIAGDATYFHTDWENSDPSRFPARIKAAATALHNCGLRGDFKIVHDDGLLEIETA
jgi:hypothetical protein